MSHHPHDRRADMSAFLPPSKHSPLRLVVILLVSARMTLQLPGPVLAQPCLAGFPRNATVARFSRPSPSLLMRTASHDRSRTLRDRLRAALNAHCALGRSTPCSRASLRLASHDPHAPPPCLLPASAPLPAAASFSSKHARAHAHTRTRTRTHTHAHLRVSPVPAQAITSSFSHGPSR
ncbi:hypothetical protein B0I35DRAFT_245 [Stachybotrys elegans]|uniref:Uncharacterized protein n=1 Tax=Stachybotrys elegans TaxID=80388 RepID=A0A8K0T1M5_9HYPO|nr:hypothetical protein B0I35DRAFT_245 [Stachybotrys elegans]